MRASPITRRARAGVSLLEVLVASFILLFGLVGVAAMFPVGRLYVEQSARYDRAAATGQAAFNDIQVRGLLQPELWVLSTGAGIDETQAYMVDPLGVAQNGDGYFPYGSNLLRRVTLPGASGPMTLPVARQVFTARDDLVVEFPDDPDAASFNRLVGPERSYEGRYSWMFSAVPKDDTAEEYVVSVIVFHQRLLNNSLVSEYNFGVASMPSGYGGGPVQLSGTQEQLETIKPGQWIMLSGTNAGQMRFSWYRVVACEDIENTANTTRWVTLHGPDWPVARGVPTNASTAEGIVAVYEKIMPRAGR